MKPGVLIVRVEGQPVRLYDKFLFFKKMLLFPGFAAAGHTIPGKSYRSHICGYRKLQRK